MTDRPIIFSAPMIVALLSGRKTQTRRVLKPQPFIDAKENFCTPRKWKPHLIWGQHIDGRPCTRNFADELYRVGDRLWVRESGHLLREAYEHYPEAGDRWRDAGFQHAVDGAVVPARAYGTPLCDWLGECSRHNRPSIHMPRWASRLTLTVTDVRVQRLQEITPADMRAEGLVPATIDQHGAGADEDLASQWVALWDTLHGEGAYAANPWVVALTFTVERRNIDAQ